MTKERLKRFHTALETALLSPNAMLLKQMKEYYLTLNEKEKEEFITRMFGNMKKEG